MSPRRHSQHRYSAVVAGSGPAGLAVVGNLLENKTSESGKVLWVDPSWRAGMLGDQWREVPSNTKANLFVAFAEAPAAFRRVIEETPTPNAMTTLKSLVQDEGCQISYAADICSMLTDGIVKQSGVEQRQGMVTGADWDDSTSSWTVQLQSPASNPVSSAPTLTTIPASLLILCTGATPTTVPISTPNLNIIPIPLATLFQPTQLTSILPPSTPVTIAVIGASHSAILVLLNLSRLAESGTHPHLHIKWFTRNKLKYAIYKDDKIYHDNTGLKGVAADFARDELEDDKLPTSPAGKCITKIDCSNGQEKTMYAEHLPTCTHIVQAVGFDTNPLPKLTRNGRALKPTYDHAKERFMDGQGKVVPGLHGAGIAFPERVMDPSGEQALSVGLWKFMKYLRRVVPEWVAGEKEKCVVL